MKKYIKPHAETVDTELTRELAEQDMTADGSNGKIIDSSSALTKDAGSWETEDAWGFSYDW